MDATFQTSIAVFNYRVAGVMIKNNHALIHKQTSDSHWALPGGRVEVLEDSQTSIKREMREELGMEVKVNRLLWVTENFFEYNSQNYHELGFYYLIEEIDNTNPISEAPFYGQEGEALIYQWVSISDISSMVLYPVFLKKSLSQIPVTPQHLIVGHYKM